MARVEWVEIDVLEKSSMTWGTVSFIFLEIPVERTDRYHTRDAYKEYCKPAVASQPEHPGSLMIESAYWG